MALQAVETGTYNREKRDNEKNTESYRKAQSTKHSKSTTQNRFRKRAPKKYEKADGEVL